MERERHVMYTHIEKEKKFIYMMRKLAIDSIGLRDYRCVVIEDTRISGVEG